MNGTRILVTGSRKYWRLAPIARALTPHRGKGLELVHGAAPGLDVMAAVIWDSWGETSEAHPADWRRHGPAAGPIRNQQMIDLGNYLVCLAFPLVGSRGTWDCVARARIAGIPVEFP